MNGIPERVLEHRPADFDLQVEITRMTFHNFAPTALLGGAALVGATAALAYSLRDTWLWHLTGFMALTCLVRVAIPLAFGRRKDPELTFASATRWQFAHASMTAVNCCNIALSTLYNFSHHNNTAQLLCTMGVYSLCVGMAATFGMRPWIAQCCGLIALAGLAYPITRYPDPVLAWSGSAMIVIFSLIYCKLVASKYEMVIEQLRLKCAMRDLAEHDALTGLANRRQFEAHLHEACRQSGTFAVLFLDLDGFKKVNDTHGHATGDALLRQVAERLKGTMRNSDLVSRFGGDEFAVLHQPIATRQSTETLGRRILDVVSAPYEIDRLSVCIGISIGIQLSGPGKNDPNLLLSQADAALYHVKQSGKGNFRFVASTEAVIIA